MTAATAVARAASRARAGYTITHRRYVPLGDAHYRGDLLSGRRRWCSAPPGAALSERELIAHCREVLPRFMVPRYVEFVRDLPRTPTQKIERVRLAGLPLSSMTWDAELSGTASTRKALS